MVRFVELGLIKKKENYFVSFYVLVFLIYRKMWLICILIIDFLVVFDCSIIYMLNFVV